MKSDPRAIRIEARNVLFQAVADENPFTRSKAIEALAGTLGPAAGQVYIKALSDPEPNVRFAATMAIGDLKYAPARDRLVQMARYKVEGAERDQRVYCGAIYALHRLGNADHMPDLGPLLWHREKEIRANVALVMGKLGEPSAIRLLESLRTQEQDVAVKLQVLESLAMLGDQASAGRLQAYTRKPFLLEKLMAITALGQFRSPQAIMALREVLHSNAPPRVRIAAAGSLARLGEVDPYGVELCLTSAREPGQIIQQTHDKSYRPPETDVRTLQELAAVSLGWTKQRRAADVLGPLLNSPNGGVRVAAAMSILRLVPATPEQPVSGKDTAGASARPAEPAERPRKKLYRAAEKQ